MHILRHVFLQRFTWFTVCHVFTLHSDLDNVLVGHQVTIISGLISRLFVLWIDL